MRDEQCLLATSFYRRCVQRDRNHITCYTYIRRTCFSLARLCPGLPHDRLIALSELNNRLSTSERPGQLSAKLRRRRRACRHCRLGRYVPGQRRERSTIADRCAPTSKDARGKLYLFNCRAPITRASNDSSLQLSLSLSLHTRPILQASTMERQFSRIVAFFYGL